MRVFLDANILFSASNIVSNIHHFLQRLSEQETLLTNAYARREAERNILLKRPQWEAGFHQFLLLLTVVDDHPLDGNIILAEKDRPILGTAIAAQCDWLLTGDKRDFGHLYNQTIEGVTVVDYLTLAKIVLQRDSFPLLTDH